MYSLDEKRITREDSRSHALSFDAAFIVVGRHGKSYTNPMNRFIYTFLVLALMSSRLVAQEPAVPDEAGVLTCFGGVIRISALIELDDSVKIGFVDTRDNRSYLLSPGEVAGDIIVIEANYENETVVLQFGDEFCTLKLERDPDASLAQQVDYDPQFFRGEAIERFLAEFPNAVEDGLIKFPLVAPPAAVGRGETIERLLNENPELRAIADMVVTGRGPGIEAMLAEHPELAEPIEIPEGSLGPGIEEAIRNNPEAMTNINMNFQIPVSENP